MECAHRDRVCWVHNPGGQHVDHVPQKLPPDRVDARSGIGVTALLACFAFQFTVAGTIPDVAYLTVADALFILAYGVTAGLDVQLAVSRKVWRMQPICRL